MTDAEAFEAMARGTEAVKLLVAKAVAAERQRIRDILWKTPMPGGWTETEQRRVTWMVAEFDRLICGLAHDQRQRRGWEPAMKVNKGDVLAVSCQRKGTYSAVATKSFDTDKHEFYPVALNQDRLDGLANTWWRGETIPCRRGQATLRIEDGLYVDETRCPHCGGIDCAERVNDRTIRCSVTGKTTP